jgi:GAF domain-containing protein
VTVTDGLFADGDRLARRLRDTLGSRFAVLSVFDGPHQVVLGSDGLPESMQGAREIPLLAGFCAYVYESGHQLVVEDVSAETTIATHPMFTALGVRAYAGWHVPGVAGRPAGVLAALEDRTRAWASAELLALMDLAQECTPAVRALLAARSTTPRGV